MSENTQKFSRQQKLHISVFLDLIARSANALRMGFTSNFTYLDGLYS